jgi:outer membrane protein assembly factor BamB
MDWRTRHRTATGARSVWYNEIHDSIGLRADDLRLKGSVPMRLLRRFARSAPSYWLPPLLLAAALLANAAPAFAQTDDVLTFHYTNDRLGWNSHEKALTPRNVNSGQFGRIWVKTLDGQVYGSPLYVSGLTVKGRKRDVVYAATENNSVYALDAATGAIVWAATQLSTPLNSTEFNNCPMISPLHGITSTPVIDRDSNTIFVCGITQPKVKQVYKIWAMDIRTGERRKGFPVVIEGSYHGCAFEAGQLVQRGALSLVNGWLYVPFGARCDLGDWHGWVAGVNTADPVAPQRLFSTSPTGDGGGIWCAGGLTADAAGNLYAVTGNGENTVEQDGEDLSESVLRLTATANGLAFSHKPKDYYMPSNYKHLDDNDEDLGAAGVLVLPDAPGAPHLLVTAGKDGLVYVLSRDNMGGVGGEVIKQRIFGNDETSYHANIRSMPAFFDAGTAGRLVYVPGDGSGPHGERGLVALRVGHAGGEVTLQQAWTSPRPFDSPASPVVSSDGQQNGIVWMVAPSMNQTEQGTAGALFAFDAINGSVLYNSTQRPVRDLLLNARKFASPTVTAGRVFVGTNGVVAYGPLSARVKQASTN